MTNKQQYQARQLAAVELDRPCQAPTLIKLEAIVSILPDTWWEQPAVRLSLTNGSQHRIAFASQQARGAFYNEVCEHFSISRHEVVEMQSEEG
ncbi:hypothetical protein [uncultured Microscilla sp.]|uniref:hypothetical protein n=1 Tax=uncultured Microscilla sp. TaxID=432653 RepID=UPI002625E29D|nr:hypothetical protein [uncultured Microscilla sp.]